MSVRRRVGLAIWPVDPFWVQVQEAVYRTAHELGNDLIALSLDSPRQLSDEEQISVVEEALAQGLDALVMMTVDPGLVRRLLEDSIPIVYLNETGIRHPLFVSPEGFYDSGRLLGHFLAEQLAGTGRVVVVGGGHTTSFEDDGSSRLAGLRDGLRPSASLELHYLPCGWHGAGLGHHIHEGLQEIGEPIHALAGLSDSVALTALEIAGELGLAKHLTLVGGINGDPAALAAVAAGRMAATVETPAAELGRRAVELAKQAAEGGTLPAHFSLKPRLVTTQNVGQVAIQKLNAMAELPNRLVGVNRRQEQERLRQLELSLELHRRIGSILDARRLSHEVANLIRAHFNYDLARIYFWDEAEQILELSQSDARTEGSVRLPLAEAGVLAAAVQRGEPIFMPSRRSYHFRSEQDSSAARSRVVVPIHLGATTLGVLDLQSEHPTQHSRQELIGLQLVADQLGIAMQNARLYAQAQEARAVAEQADQWKTRLLAGVSHELRGPLTLIMGYSQAALARSNTDEPQLITVPRNDLQQIYRSGEHLLRLINDLLDLSRAESNGLELFPEPITVNPFLRDVFAPVAASAAARAEVAWRLELPEQSPTITADPLRLRQVLLNLLSNADKFTQAGEIVLRAEVTTTHLHISVRDTGCGIPIDLQERVFEPFVSSPEGGRNRGGAGLGLAIARWMVALHGGVLTLESQPGQGSAFHLYLPLTRIAPRADPSTTERKPALLFMSSRGEPPPAITASARRRGLPIRILQATDEPGTLLREIQPAALAWDLADRDAWALVEQYRAYQEYFQAPLLLFHTPHETAQAENAGITHVLTKPFDQRLLLRTLGALRPSDGRGSILIVDDDMQTRELYATLIRRELPDFPVITAPNGAAAISILRRETPALLILDLMMPEVDGFEVLAQLRMDPRTRQVPVIVISGQMLSQDDIRRLDYARVTFQGKEILSEDETVTRLREALSGVEALPQQTSKLVKRAVAYIHQHYAAPLSRRQIAEAAGVSKDYLGRIFQQELGLSPSEYVTRYRIVQAKALLRGGDSSIADVARLVGLDDPSYFGRVFRKVVGRSPRAYREQPD